MLVKPSIMLLLLASVQLSNFLRLQQSDSLKFCLEKFSRMSEMQGSRASLKVLEFCSLKFKTLKVLENRAGAWKCLSFIPQVLERPWIHQVKLRDISNFVKQHFSCCHHVSYLDRLSVCQVFCLNQDLLIIVVFCFYQLKLYRNHTNRY